MIPNSKAYAVLRDKSQEFLDFAVLTCTSVPTLVNEINLQGVTNLKPDYFKGVPDGNQLIAHAADYQIALSRMIVITLFSYFEAYVQELLSEIVDFHGGAVKFQAIADRRAKEFVAASSAQIIESKRKLQEPEKGSKKLSYQKHSAKLSSLGFRFPSELLAPYGVKNLIKKSRPKGSKAFEIPELIRDALCFPLTPAEESRLNKIRDTRNTIAHGKPSPLGLKDALGIGKELRSIAAKVDGHAVEHFFVLELYA